MTIVATVQISNGNMLPAENAAAATAAAAATSVTARIASVDRAVPHRSESSCLLLLQRPTHATQHSHNPATKTETDMPNTEKRIRSHSAQRRESSSRRMAGTNIYHNIATYNLLAPFSSATTGPAVRATSSRRME